MTYRVWVSFSGGAYYDVEANNESDARSIALEEADPFDCQEWDFDTEIEN